MQVYYDGIHEIDDDEALIIETELPKKCRYWQMLVADDRFSTIDWVNRQSSLNDSQARIDGDGVLRAVISSRDPGVPNWLDKANVPWGVIQMRWNKASDHPDPKIQKVAFSEVRKYLPADTPVVTPAQRKEQLRARREARADAEPLVDAAQRRAIAVAREQADGVGPVPRRTRLRDLRQVREEGRRRLGDLGEEAEVAHGVVEGDAARARIHLARELVAQAFVVRLLPVVVARHRADLVEARLALAEQVAVDARTIAELLDQLDLHRARLRDGDLEVDASTAAPR